MQAFKQTAPSVAAQPGWKKVYVSLNFKGTKVQAESLRGDAEIAGSKSNTWR